MASQVDTFRRYKVMRRKVKEGLIYNSNINYIGIGKYDVIIDFANRVGHI